jgi:hypothetical protein
MTILSFLIGGVAAFLFTREHTRRLHAERNLARLERDRAEQDRDQALRGNVLVFDATQRSKAVHPAGSRLPQQDRR